MNIAVDVDGVLCAFLPSWYKVLNELWLGQIEPGYTPHDWNHSDRITLDQIGESFEHIKKEYNWWFRCDPLIGARELQQHLSPFRHRNINIYYVTARMDTAGDTALVQTRNWLAHRGLLYSNCSVVVVPKPERKRPLFELLNITYSIDDKPETVVDCSTQLAGHKATLMDASYNRQDEFMGLPRVRSVEEWCQKVLSSQSAHRSH